MENSVPRVIYLISLLVIYFENRVSSRTNTQLFEVAQSLMYILLEQIL